MHLCSQSSRWPAVLYKPELSWAEEEWESRSLLVFAQLGVLGLAALGAGNSWSSRRLREHAAIKNISMST